MRIDRLILKDVWGPWLFGVGLFSALLMAATYLGHIAGLIVDGVPFELVLHLTALYMPAILAKTFSMSVLLATLLGFGRLSSDSEIVALRAAGASLYRIIVPVFAFSAAIALITFGFNEQIVPAAAAEADRVNAEALHRTNIKLNQPISRTEIVDNKLRLAIVAKNVIPATQLLQGVVITSFDKDENANYFILAEKASYDGLSNWKLHGNVRLIAADGRSYVTVPDDVWPAGVPTPTEGFAKLTAPRNDNFDTQTMAELAKSIEDHKLHRDMKLTDIHNMEYGYWTKLAFPLAAITFGILGAVLGIRSHRAGTATGFALAVAIIFGYVTIANFMNVWAIGGLIPAWAASFAPLAIGAVASGVIMWRRNS